MAYRYHPEIEGLKVNEDGSEFFYNGKALRIGKLKQTHRGDNTHYVYFGCKTYSVAKLVCECWHGMAENPRWRATRKVKANGFHYTNLFFAPSGTNREISKTRSTSSKIPKEAIPLIEKRLQKGETLNVIARDYKVSDMSISRIKKRMNINGKSI